MQLNKGENDITTGKKNMRREEFDCIALRLDQS